MQLRHAAFFCALVFSAAPAHSAASRLYQFVHRDSLSRHTYSGSMDGYFERLEKKGFTTADLEIADVAGNLYFDAPALAEQGWTDYPDRLFRFSKEWDLHRKAAGTRRVRSSLNLSALSRVLYMDEDELRDLNKPRPKEFEQLLLDLQEHHRFEEWTLEPPPSEYLPTFYGTLRTSRRRWNAVAPPEIFDRYLDSNAFAETDLLQNVSRLIVSDCRLYPGPGQEAALPSVGYVDALFALARAGRKEVWIAQDDGCWNPNLWMYRTLQYAPHGFVPPLESDPHAAEFDAQIRPQIREFYSVAQSSSSGKRKIANLILGAGRDRGAEPLLAQYMDAVMNAMQANGYEVHATVGRILPDADLYYVTNGADWSADLIFFDELLDVMNHRKSRFYGSMILHPMGEIETDGPWRRLRDLFRIPNAEGGWLKSLPRAVSIRRRDILWGGNVPEQRMGMTQLREPLIAAHRGEAILTEVFEGETQALILRSGNHYLVNGNFLNLEASYFLSHLMGGAILNPASAYITSDRFRTVILAATPGRVKLKIPAPELPPEWRLVHWDAAGKRIKDERAKSSPIFEIELKANELVLLDYGRR